MKSFHRILSLILVFVLAVQLCPFAFAQEITLPLWDEEWQMLLLTNRERLMVGRAPLTTTDFLQDATDIRAQELLELFSHDRPDGRSCFTVLDDVGAPPYMTVGENIAFGFHSPEAVIEGWVNSPGHYSNMISENFVHVGVGDVLDTRNWVQFFYTGFECGYIEASLSFPMGRTFEVGTAIDDMLITGLLHCKNCGTSYLPIMNEFCSGYDPNQVGEQTVTARFLGFETEFVVTLQSAPQPPSSPFADVSASDWYFDAVCYAAENNLMNGMGENRFEPNGNMTRAMLVTVLWRFAGSIEEGEATFVDVQQNQWYSKAVTWAAHNGIVGGVGNNRFNPEGNITREQMAAILYRYATTSGKDTTATAELGSFPDGSCVSTYATDAMRWAVAEGLINGSDGKLLPQGDATRAQVAAILMRFIENVMN